MADGPAPYDRGGLNRLLEALLQRPVSPSDRIGQAFQDIQAPQYSYGSVDDLLAAQAEDAGDMKQLHGYGAKRAAEQGLPVDEIVKYLMHPQGAEELPKEQGI